jgi:hypothetical protein
MPARIDYLSIAHHENFGPAPALRELLTVYFQFVQIGCIENDRTAAARLLEDAPPCASQLESNDCFAWRIVWCDVWD